MVSSQFSMHWEDHAACHAAAMPPRRETVALTLAREGAPRHLELRSDTWMRLWRGTARAEDIVYGVDRRLCGKR